MQQQYYARKESLLRWMDHTTGSYNIRYMTCTYVWATNLCLDEIAVIAKQQENTVKRGFISVTSFIFKCQRKTTNSSQQGENYFCGIYFYLWWDLDDPFLKLRQCRNKVVSNTMGLFYNFCRHCCLRRFILQNQIYLWW